MTPDALRTAVRAALDHPEYRRAAEQLATEIAAMPTPDQLVPEIEGLIGR